jgi:hypothetical protein
MPRSTQRARRRRATPARQESRAALRQPSDQRNLLDRILDTPHLARAVPQLQPELLHRLIESCGLEDCGALVALATPGQLMRVLDLDLWRSARPGSDERLDADRFGVWLEVLMEAGAGVAAEKLIGMDVDLVIASLAQHLLVFDCAAVSPYTTLDGDEFTPRRQSSGGPACEIGGYLIEAKRDGPWDAIVALLLYLDVEHAAYFNRVMRGCRNLSSSGREVDGLHDLLTDSEQDLFDLALDREQRREQQGYVTPAQAGAFLQMARELQLQNDSPPPRNPVADAYFRAIDWTAPADANQDPSRLEPASDSPATPDDQRNAIAAVVDVLVEAGVIPQPPRALLGGAHDDEPRRSRIQSHMQAALDFDPAAYSMRSEELAYLANALAAGCSLQARPFSPREASDAAAAICNLGLERWPAHWLPAQIRSGSRTIEAGTVLPDGFLLAHDLVRVFQVGWTVLHREVSMYAAGRLIDIVAGLRCGDRDIQAGLDALGLELTRHWRDRAPWRAHDALDVLMILDQPAWATLLALIAECPVIHAGLRGSRDPRTRTVSASAFDFISESRQIAAVREFMDSLPDTLRG